MKLTTKVRYAARAMLDVATNGDGSPVPMKDIAERQDIPESYLRQLVGPLRAAGLIRVVRGPRGGLELIKSPSEIKISELCTAMEGNVSLVECVYDPDICPQSGDCPTRDLWAEMTEAILKVMEARTLQDLIHCTGDSSASPLGFLG